MEILLCPVKLGIAVEPSLVILSSDALERSGFVKGASLMKMELSKHFWAETLKVKVE